MEHEYSFLRSIFYLRQATDVNEDFKRNVIIKTTAAHFVKKVSWLSQKCFSTNYREHNMNLKVKETWRNLPIMISTQQKVVSSFKCLILGINEQLWKNNFIWRKNKNLLYCYYYCYGLDTLFLNKKQKLLLTIYVFHKIAWEQKISKTI